jgi:hypothetical protein
VKGNAEHDLQAAIAEIKVFDFEDRTPSHQSVPR